MSELFEFSARRWLDAPRDAVFTVLADAEAWGRWWPQIRRITPHTDTTGEVRIRSVLPVTLVLQLTSEQVDEASGDLRARLDGDLQGWAWFHLAPQAGGTDVSYRQSTVLVHPRLPHIAATALRPVLRANHAWMMRAGLLGLEAEARRRSGA